MTRLLIGLLNLSKTKWKSMGSGVVRLRRSSDNQVRNGALRLNFFRSFKENEERKKNPLPFRWPLGLYRWIGWRHLGVIMALRWYHLEMFPLYLRCYSFFPSYSLVILSAFVRVFRRCHMYYDLNIILVLQARYKLTPNTWNLLRIDW